MNELVVRLNAWGKKLQSEVLAVIPRRTPTNPSELARRNAKGDRQERFDLVAHETVLRLLKEEFESGVILSEEAAEVAFGNSCPQWRFVIDPVDGSDNWKRRLPLSAICVAAFPTDSPIDVSQVAWSVVCSLSGDTPYVAVKSEGAWQGSQRLFAGASQRLERAVISIELNHLAPSGNLSHMLCEAGGVRSYCSTAMCIAMIACGMLDIHLDVRSLVTPESYLASSLVLREAGGILSDLRGQHLAPLQGLTDRRNLIAAANEGLLKEVVDRLRGYHAGTRSGDHNCLT